MLSFMWVGPALVVFAMFGHRDDAVIPFVLLIVVTALVVHRSAWVREVWERGDAHPMPRGFVARIARYRRNQELVFAAFAAAFHVAGWVTDIHPAELAIAIATSVVVQVPRIVRLQRFVTSDRFGMACSRADTLIFLDRHGMLISWFAMPRRSLALELKRILAVRL